MSHFEKNKGPRAGSTQATWYTSQGRILPICSMDLWLDPGVVMPLTLGNQTFSTQSWKEISRFCPVDPTLMQNSSKQWDLEVQMGVITNLCPFSNLCQSLLYLFQGFLSETFCQTWGSWADAWFPLWMAASKSSHNQLSRWTPGQPSMALFHMLNGGKCMGWVTYNLFKFYCTYSGLWIWIFWFLNCFQ